MDSQNHLLENPESDLGNVLITLNKWKSWWQKIDELYSGHDCSFRQFENWCMSWKLEKFACAGSKECIGRWRPSWWHSGQGGFNGQLFGLRHGTNDFPLGPWCKAIQTWTMARRWCCPNAIVIQVHHFSGTAQVNISKEASWPCLNLITTFCNYPFTCTSKLA